MTVGHKKNKEDIMGRLRAGELESGFFNHLKSTDFGSYLMIASDSLAFLGVLYLGVMLLAGIFNKAKEV